MTTTEPAIDIDPEETREWLDALDGVLENEGPARAQQLVERIVERAQTGGAHVELGVQTPYVNTIPVAQQPSLPGTEELETRIRHLVRWNAMALVVRANEESSNSAGTSLASHRRRCSTTSASIILAGAHGRVRRRPRLLPRSLVAGHLRARLHGRPL